LSHLGARLSQPHLGQRSSRPLVTYTLNPGAAHYRVFEVMGVDRLLFNSKMGSDTAGLGDEYWSIHERICNRDSVFGGTQSQLTPQTLSLSMISHLLSEISSLREPTVNGAFTGNAKMAKK